MKTSIVYQSSTLIIELCWFYPEDGIESFYRLTLNTVVYELPSWFSFDDETALAAMSATDVLNTINTQLEQQMEQRVKRAQDCLTEFQHCGLTMFAHES